MASLRKRTAQVAAGLATSAMIGLVAARALHGGSTLAGHLQDNPLDAPPRQAHERERAIRRDVSPRDADAPPAADALEVPDPPRSPFRARDVGPEPAQDAEEFITRTHKEAADRIAALDREATELKARLTKVEAASARLKAAFKNLDDSPRKAPEAIAPPVDAPPAPELAEPPKAES